MSSNLGINQMNQLANKLSDVGWGSRRVTQLGQATDGQFRHIAAYLDGRAEVTIKSRLSESTAVILPAVEVPVPLKVRKNVSFYGMAGDIFGVGYEMPAAKERTVERRDLLEPLGDIDTDEMSGIIIELGDGAVVPIALMDLIIGQLIDAVEAGSDALYTGRKANIGYIHNPNNHKQMLCISVRRYGSDDWRVGCDFAGSGQWSAGSRVLKETVV